jgi:drug/metabolite transporter (DMT)-like permease
VTLWATAFVGIRSAGRHFSPGALSLGRLLVGALALGLIMLLRREALPAKPDLPCIVVCGVLWFGLYNLTLNAGERRIDAGTAAMLVNIGPILIALLAWLFLGEGLPRTLILGCAIAFSGSAVIALATSHGGGDWLGAVLCVTAAVCWACGVIAQKPLLSRLSALQVTWAACLVGAVVCLPFLPSLVHQARSAPASAVGWIVFLGVLPTAVAFTTWAYALSKASAGRTGSMTYLVPPLAILIGWEVLGEVPPALAFAGGALCLVGVAVVQRGRAR